MLKSLAFVSLLATAAAATAQAPAPPTAAADATEQAPAPIVRSYQSTPAPQAAPEPDSGQSYPRPGRAPMPGRTRRPEQDADQTSQQILDSQPIAGVWLRSRSTAVLKTISATPHGTEIRLEHGILNVNVHQPAIHSEILIDLPGGQTSLLKDGLYTFNADTNTVRVLHGEAAAYPGTARSSSEKAVKIKESHQLAFAPNPAAPGSATAATTTAARLKPAEAYPYELAADLLPAGNGDGNAYAHNSGSGYGYGDDGPYGYPYAAGAWGYPYGFYPYGVGIGFGYGYYGGYRGFYGGGYRGFYGGGRGFYGGGRGFRR